MLFILAPVLVLGLGVGVGVGEPQQPPMRPALPIRNFLRVTPDICTAGQPPLDQFAALKADGVRAVLNLRTPGEYKIDDEIAAVKAAGLAYFNIPVVYMSPTDAQADEFLRITDDPANRPLFIHCTAAIRVGAFWLIRRVVRDHWTWDAALAEARTVGLANAAHLETFARNYIAKQPQPAATRTPAAPAPKAAQAAAREWTGRVTTGIMAIGGESTGIVIETSQGEKDRLELTGNAAMLAQLQKLNGQTVTSIVKRSAQ